MRPKLRNRIGFTLLAICFLASLSYRVRSHMQTAESSRSETVTIRFAHWQLENGAREAFEKIAEEYTKLNPKVMVVQLPIPEEIYPNWLVTQLVGGTAPDLIEVILDAGVNDERIAHFFTPLTDLADAPNPYNKGTDLDGIPLRETFFDGMKGGYFNNLVEYYAVPVSCPTVRMFFNLELLRKITGSDHIPDTYAEMIRLFSRVKEYSDREGVRIFPIAGAKSNSLQLMNRLFNGQTQTLVENLNPVGIINENEVDCSVRRASDYLAGRWSLDSAAVRSGFNLMREISQQMQPGFLRAEREDATLLFIRGQALIITSGSWDATSIRQQATFPVGLAPLPFPTPQDSTYGKYTKGAPSEAGNKAAAIFALTRNSAHPEVARDFLLFLASRSGNQIWTDISGWPPAIIGTKVRKDIAPFLPISEGYVLGLQPNISWMGFLDLTSCCTTHYHLLFGSNGSAEAFVQAVKPLYGDAIVSDLRRILRSNQEIVKRNDTQFAALTWIARNHLTADADRKLDQFLQSATLTDRRLYQTRLALAAKQ